MTYSLDKTRKNNNWNKTIVIQCGDRLNMFLNLLTFFQNVMAQANDVPRNWRKRKVHSYNFYSFIKI